MVRLTGIIVREITQRHKKRSHVTTDVLVIIIKVIQGMENIYEKEMCTVSISTK